MPEENRSMPMRPLDNTISKSLVIKGELSADEDVMLEGRVEGAINLNGAALTVGRLGKVEAAIVAKSVVVAGEVRGDIRAAEEVILQDTCVVEGDLAAPSVTIARGADVRGRIRMRQPVGDVPVPQPVSRSVVSEEMPAASNRSRSLWKLAALLVGGAWRRGDSGGSPGR